LAPCFSRRAAAPPGVGGFQSSACDYLGEGWEGWSSDETNPDAFWYHRQEIYPHMYGCGALNTSAIVSTGNGYQTCHATGYTGSVVFRFTLRGRFTSKDVTLGVGSDVGPPCVAVNNVVPYYGVDCGVTVTPEPSTWAPTGTGLLGLVAVARHRRRGRLIPGGAPTQPLSKAPLDGG
jgi:MYXO-CTERM domain-containing protein